MKKSRFDSRNGDINKFNKKIIAGNERETTMC